ncbi:hypothetical protein LTR78_004936 [Recurvomyces mirabilis]|uniref:Major facilitator superfamily (MFS) profile domain-containing protein n=1 Tax=Recurvomyces mirabilis TaxID=574656 RepID=A0AAE0WNL3_9PEZI|nr:hypothetical protein LTR78_004936 [Recurvomyces mirabilis]KAK5158447.1 hypothetical protein LTS14_003466 [Recurvomyces mirabilis]
MVIMAPERTVTTDYFADDDGDNYSITTKASTITMDEPSKHNDASEHSPLLATSPAKPGSYIELPPRKSRISYRSLLLVLIAMVILSSASDQIIQSPQMRIFESIICYRHYEQADPSRILLGRATVGPGAIGGVAEADCKIDEVQGELAMLNGYQQFFNGFPSLLLAIPLGWAADRYGRKPFLAVGLVSFAARASWVQLVTWFWQAFDIRLTWLSTLPTLVSGGDVVISGLFFVLLSDIVPEAERASTFLRVGACSILASVAMPPFAAMLMQTNPWIPCLIGLVLNFIPMFLLILVPETLNYRKHLSPYDSFPPTPSEETQPGPPDLADNNPPMSANYAARIASQVVSATDFLTADWRIPALILPFFGHMLMFNATQLLLQYMSKRYHITFSKATLLNTIFNGVKILGLFLILPYISKVIMRIFKFSDQRKDLYLARGTQVLLAVGYLFIGLSPTVPSAVLSMTLAALGMGTYLFVRSFLTSLVPSHHIARIYMIITLLETLGGMSGGALMANLFKGGLQLGGGWIGLPFLFVGLVMLCSTALLCTVRLRPGEDRKQDGDEQQM